MHPDRVLANQGLRHGDCLLLTKPVGTGIVNTAIKGGLASAETIKTVTESMAELNMKAANIMTGYPVSACTDVTGFGLMGHLAEMIAGTGTEVTIWSDSVPTMPEAEEFASMGFVPVGAPQEPRIPRAHDFPA